ncbi:MAG: Dihydroorotate oxidase [Parcubacteria group bacterium GW2011_GWF2_38_8]|nr:MAG: Dihydroorotate oxidase [Parcubacteria group bacterium GW2011_GWF2_38_8]
MNTPFYNPRKSYEENFAEGPFGAFTDGEVVENTGEPKYDFLGQKAYSPFGIPAGPLINSNFCRPAFDKGFDICVYKTVRSSFFPCHPFPNILPVKIKGDLTLEKAQSKLMTGNRYSMPISITNSFGVPSKEASIWQADVKKAISYAKKGQILVLGFMGTIRESQTAEEFIADYALVAKQAKETGVKILETNLSCPNIGNEGLVCYNLDMTEKICRAIRKEIGNTPLVFKVGYYKDYEDVKKLAEIAGKYGQAISAINTISAEVVGKNGSQALPGRNRLRSGICGASIKWAGLEMAGKLKKARSETGTDFKIIGVGGVVNPEDFKEYIDAGADFVMSATGAMWNPYLAREIKETLI